ncbi:MAG TPA: FAD binding domain-containing protein [Vicinamibacterales bacterium]|nr:FAD binding domain-containing protein [Vicinamibacterales bacterium]
MKPVAFDYARPADVASALKLAGTNGAAKFIAGGQSLGPMLNLRLVQPGLLVDITAIDDLKRAEAGKDALFIGSCITHADIEDGRIPDVTNGALPLVAAGIAYRAVRNRGTIGGSIVHADPAADWISALSALDALAVVRGAKGTRRVRVAEFIVGVFETQLDDGEILMGVEVPRHSSASRWGYYKLSRKTGEFAHAMGVYHDDRDRNVFRAVIGATGGAPIVIADKARLFAGREPAAGALDESYIRQKMAAAGLTDVIDQNIRVAALRRAVAKAVPS